MRYCFLFFFVLLSRSVLTQPPASIITIDLLNFWEAVDSLTVNKDTTAVFQQMVINRASPAFQIFIKKWNIKATDYHYQLRRLPQFYQSLRANTLRLINNTDSVQTLIKKFRLLYPGFKEATICIAIGNFNTGGNFEIKGSKNYVYIGLEFHAVDSSINVSEHNKTLKDYLTRGSFYRTIIHELVHVQHRTHGSKIAASFTGNLLLNRVLSEGIPDFIAAYIAGGNNTANNYIYGTMHEAELKEQLKTELYMKGSGNWFGGDDKLFINRPHDLGYFMGHKIAKHFFMRNQLTNDLTALIEIKNPQLFVEQSDYFKQQL